ncbi:type III pantothenate kinase [Lysobacter solisilvae (ex Woo and Kim 2020)]|uniref:Type III pantothenate kinase n=1 Tax=Agrilutibacter terrestris TaxID=2865112 RepID=A0A7H0FZM2_9GAMM|nr:type III pantothenate kinase [Lysobacter terrestris]QNP41488.1 type III pantothenate kinase [Lysobacter terrestris]
MSTWLFDLGNTRLKCAPLRDGRVGDVVALPHREADLADALLRLLPERIDVAHVASVANEALRVALLQALTLRARRITLARTQRVFGGFRIAYAQPHKLGVDRFLAMLGAHARFREPVLLCGVGTALTVDLVDADGLHLGGRIAPSPTLMREALHERAPHLPVHGGEPVDFAADTEDALASGCEGAALALIEASRIAAQRRLGRMPRLVLHGGGVEELAACLPDATHATALVLDGLAIWASVDTPG